MTCGLTQVGSPCRDGDEELGLHGRIHHPPAREVAGRSTFAVDRFVEKPTAEVAAALIATGLASWNAGIFAWSRATIRDRLERHSPDILAAVRAIVADGTLFR